MSVSSEKAPVGVFDSGVGGLSVLRHIHTLLPDESLLYAADSLHAPYGNKSADFIRERAFWLSEFLLARGAKALVVACNTATAAAVSAMRERYDLPIIGMEPAVKPAAAASRSGVVGVLATSGTLKSAQFAALLESYGQHVQVVTQACHGLVECIERGELNAESTKLLLKVYLQPLLDAGADTIVLGCTHYPFVHDLIKTSIEELAVSGHTKKDVAKEIVLIDTGAAVARHLKHRLEEAGLRTSSPKAGSVGFWSNSPSMDAQQVISQLWGGDVEVAALD